MYPRDVWINTMTPSESKRKGLKILITILKKEDSEFFSAREKGPCSAIRAAIFLD